MEVEVLVSTMDNHNVTELINKMNLKTPAIVINQADKIAYEEYLVEDQQIKCFWFNERGVGLSRNNALMRSTKEICLMADDDMVYIDGYQDKILEAYKMYPDADMIVFNVRIHENNKTRSTVKKNTRVRWYNCLRYGTVTFSFKRNSILKDNIFFSLEFGGGAKYGSGEDSLFITDVLKRGNKIYAVDTTIADVYNENSSWFTGYNEKYFFDRGALFKRISPKFFKLLIVQFIIRKSEIIKLSNMTRMNIYKTMIMGAKNDK